MAKFNIQEADDFEPVDVSEPREVRTEREIIAEERATYRRMWLREHRMYIFAVIGILLVLLIVFGVRLFHQNTNPWSRLMQASAKNFGTSFAFDMNVKEEEQPVMAYKGSIAVNREKQQLRVVYDAQYTDYSYSAATVADGQMFAAGNLYDGVWRVRDNSESVHDFFDFDTDYCKGTFDAGAFLRFTKLNGDYSATELQRFMETLSQRLAGDSDLAKIKTEKVENGTQYRYDFSVKALMDMIATDGASVFYRSSDYDKFREKYAANEGVAENSSCTLEYTISNNGYLTALNLNVTIGEQHFALELTAHDFGSAVVSLPEEFLSAAAAMQEEKEN